MRKMMIVLTAAVIGAALLTGCKPKEGVTVGNLKKAIIGETTASAKYKAYADKAREEKLDAIAILFEAASKAESYHAIKHRAVLEKMGAKMDDFKPQYEVKSTKENLASAIKGENYEVDPMYPGFIKSATEEKMDDAVTSFNYALAAEKLHSKLYSAASEALAKNDLKSLPASYAVCPICGNTVAGNAPDACDICGAAQKEFLTVK